MSDHLQLVGPETVNPKAALDARFEKIRERAEQRHLERMATLREEQDRRNAAANARRFRRRERLATMIEKIQEQDQ